MTKEESQLFIQAILQNDRRGLLKIYDQFLPEVARLTRLNAGTDEDAKDLLQEAILILFKKLKSGDLTFTESFGAYLMGICKKLWLKRLEKNRKLGVTFSDDLERAGSTDDFEAVMAQEEQFRLFRAKFRELTESCQKLLTLFFDKTPMQEIVNILGFASVEYAKKRKFQCKENLVQLIKSDPRYHDLT